VTALVNGQQAVVGRYQYDPFGNTQSAVGPMAELNAYRYASKEMHLPSGLVYFGSRYYDPGLQRWLNPDPIEEAGGLNLYAYCGNSPVLGHDPWGTEPPTKKLDKGLHASGSFADHPSLEGFWHVVGASPFDLTSGAASPSDPNYTPSSLTPVTSLDAVHMPKVVVEGRNVLPVLGDLSMMHPFPPSPLYIIHTGDAWYTEWGDYLRAEVEAGKQQLMATMPWPEAAVGMTCLDFIAGILNTPERWANFASGTGAFVGDPSWSGGLGVLDDGLTLVQIVAPSVGLRGAAAKTATPSGQFYSVAFETRLNPSSYPGVLRPAHFQEANEILLRAMEAETQFARIMQQGGVNLQRTATGLAPRTAPAGWTWHHAQEAGVMQLVPRSQHAPGSIFQDVLHPGGQGGYSIWGQ
jgi:RHS repeat-associated protein